MPVPSNTSAATAIDLGSFPCDVTQDVHDAGTNYTVWYKFTAPTDSRVIGIWGFSPTTDTFRTTLWVYSDAGFTSYLSIVAQNVPIQIPVTPGNTYWLRFIKNGDTSPASLRIRGEVATNGTPVQGNFVVNDDTDLFPLAVLSHLSDFSVVAFFQPVVAGEQGDITHTAPIIILLSDETSGNNEFVFYNSNFVRTTEIPFLEIGPPIIRLNRTSRRFWIGNAGSGATPAKFNYLTELGTLGPTTYTLPQAGLSGLAVNDDSSIAYYTGSGGTINAPVKRWDLINNIALSDLAPGQGASYTSGEMLILEDGTLLVNYSKFTSPRDLKIIRYDSSGTILNTYTIDLTTNNAISNKLAYALDSPDSFWVWTNTSSIGVSNFRNIRISDGSVLSLISQMEYEGGVYQGAETDTPNSRFGNSFSCPFFIYAEAPTENLSGIYVIVPGKTHDTFRTTDVKIPFPFFDTALLGD